MANIAAIRSVGSSLAEYLDRSYQAAVFPPNVSKPNCTFSVVSSGGIQEAVDPENSAASVQIFLYHVGIDPHLRNSGRLVAPDMVRRLFPWRCIICSRSGPTARRTSSSCSPGRCSTCRRLRCSMRRF